MVNKQLFNVGEIVFYYNKWNNEIEKGEITDTRPAKYNWDYNIRYYITKDLIYCYWIQQDHIGRDEQVLYRYLA